MNIMDGLNLFPPVLFKVTRFTWSFFLNISVNGLGLYEEFLLAYSNDKRSHTYIELKYYLKPNKFHTGSYTYLTYKK